MHVTPTQHIQRRRSNNVRIGPISIITLISVICMAVLAVLAVSTSSASTTISQRQADAMQALYADECAGQEFVASVDDVLAQAREEGDTPKRAANAVERELDAICEKARAAANGDITCTASVNGRQVTAEFVCDNTRQLNVMLVINDDVTMSVQQWKMTSAQQAPQSAGQLWSGN